LTDILIRSQINKTQLAARKSGTPCLEGKIGDIISSFERKLQIASGVPIL
jgi:hypothetical protein